MVCILDMGPGYEHILWTRRIISLNSNPESYKPVHEVFKLGLILVYYEFELKELWKKHKRLLEDLPACNFSKIVFGMGVFGNTFFQYASGDISA